MPNPLDLERVKTYCEKATAGPWHLHFYNVPNNPVFALEAGGDGDDGEFGQLWGGGPDEWPAGANAEFIANSRTDLPAAVEEIERLRAEVAALTHRLSVIEQLRVALRNEQEGK